MKLIIFLISMLASNLVWAAAYTSSGSGDWGDPATWGGAGFPTATDSATILATHVVTIDGSRSVGTSPGNTTTYDLDISGTLFWPSAPGADWTFTAYSSVRIQGNGKIQVGTPGSPLDCSDHGIFEFATAAAGQKYYLNIAGGSLNIYGCENFDTSSGSVHRARISACAPDCSAGGGRTITFDRDVNWNPSTGWDGDRILVGIGGSVANPPAAGDDPEEITSWGIPGGTSDQIDNVTFTEDHQVGDLVVNASKNFIVRSDSATVHARIYAAAIDDPFDLNWFMMDELGDDTSTAAGLVFNGANNTIGTIYYVSALNCEDGGATACFYLQNKNFTTVEGLVAFDYRGGYGTYLRATAFSVHERTIKDPSMFEGPNGTGYGIYLSTYSSNLTIDGLWTSHGSYGIYSTGAFSNVLNSIVHGMTIDGIVVTDTSQNTRTLQHTVSDNEVRNINRNGIEILSTNTYFYNNDIDTCGDNCVLLDPLYSAFLLYADGNSYDNCNTDNSVSQAAFYVNDVTGYIHANNESFGQANANYRANYAWAAPNYTSSTGVFRAVCNNCLFATPTNALTCASMPTDGIYLYGCTSGYTYASYIPQESYFNLHNKDQVEYSIVGWGPGGAVVSRDTTTTYTNSNIKMKIVPMAANLYGCHSIGSFYTESGKAITASVYLRKDEAVADAGWRPRLALQGCGFTKYHDYDEMSDVNNTWEKVEVAGTSEWRGVIHMYVCARGKLSGVNDYEPVFPPTLEVWADGVTVVK